MLFFHAFFGKQSSRKEVHFVFVVLLGKNIIPRQELSLHHCNSSSKLDLFDYVDLPSLGDPCLRVAGDLLLLDPWLPQSQFSFLFLGYFDAPAPAPAHQIMPSTKWFSMDASSSLKYRGQFVCAPQESHLDLLEQNQRWKEAIAKVLSIPREPWSYRKVCKKLPWLVDEGDN
nr:hypothetical protein Iba_chr05bCG4010 [Ipomoea batatas]